MSSSRVMVSLRATRLNGSCGVCRPASPVSVDSGPWPSAALGRIYNLVPVRQTRKALIQLGLRFTTVDYSWR
jgi:hypothetical protein